MSKAAHLVLVLVDHGTVNVPIARTDRDFDLCPKRSDPASGPRVHPFPLPRSQPERGKALTAFSTSFGFDSHVPSPICGIDPPDESVIVLPKDILRKSGGCAEIAGGRFRLGEEMCAQIASMEMEMELAAFIRPVVFSRPVGCAGRRSGGEARNDREAAYVA